MKPEKFDPQILKNLYLPSKRSHKGQNGKLTIIGGSKLFHGASLWALKVASRIVDMVFYSSVPENNQLVEKLKAQVFDFIAVPRDKVNAYIEESDVVLIGPGMPREEGKEKGEEATKTTVQRFLTEFPNKKWVIDGGALTESEEKWIPRSAILTPHLREFYQLFGNQESGIKNQELVQEKAKRHNCTILLKGPTDIICSQDKCILVKGGNEGMTKGGTGDVLAGLIAALYCKNDAFLAASAASYINKKAGEDLYKTAGPFYNASDLCDQLPKTMKRLLNL